MATETFTQIASTTLGSNSGAVTFSSLGSYTDLLLVASYTCTSAANMYISFNGDYGANYIATYQYANGTAVNTSRQGTIYTNVNSTVAGNQTTDFIDLFDYRNTSFYKTVLGKHITPGVNITQFSGIWKNTGAVTSITYNSTANFTAGSTFCLYGITKA